MAIELRPRIEPGLHLRMAPQMFQLMRILAQPGLELRQEMAAALADNPALEEESESDEDITRLLDHLDGGVGRDLAGVAREREVDDPDGSILDRIPSAAPGLAEHLRQQLREETDDEKARAIGEWIIGNLDADGYLREEVTALATSLGVAPQEVTDVLRRIQEFEPIGVGAADARECLLIQARVRFPDRPWLARLIECHLPDLKERRYSVIARALGVGVDAVRDEERVLVTLNPRPARGFGRDTAVPIIPDVRIFRVGGDLVVRVNDDGLPKLRVSAQFRRILRAARGARSEEVAYARARVTAATWFLRCVYERQRTIVRVTEAIVERQREFFEHGRQSLRPMILRDVADDIGTCESTVSRVTSGKYAETPQGVLELKHFFGAGIRGANGAEVAPEAAKEMIRRIVALEDPARPLSDQQILSRLRSDRGVVIARRTVAKYRGVLGIASSSRRKQ